MATFEWPPDVPHSVTVPIKHIQKALDWFQLNIINKSSKWAYFGLHEQIFHIEGKANILGRWLSSPWADNDTLGISLANRLTKAVNAPPFPKWFLLPYTGKTERHRIDHPSAPSGRQLADTHHNGRASHRHLKHSQLGTSAGHWINCDWSIRLKHHCSHAATICS